MFYYIAGDADVAAWYYIHEQTRDTSYREIPVLADDDFLTGTSDIVPVTQFGGRYRSLLRLYDPDALVVSDLRVRAVSLTGGGVIADRVVSLRIVPEAAGQPRRFPAYAEVPMDETFFFPGVRITQPLRIEIEPARAGQRYWAMLSMTRNDTNETTIVTPRGRR
jgi:hypothetical protein